MSLTLNAKLKYKKTFGSHGIDAILGFEQNSYRKDNFWASRGSFMSTAIDQLFAGTSNKDYYDNSGDASESARRSYFGRVAYDFAGKYMAQFNFRYDGSYIFQAGQRWGFFPGVSAGWRMSEESFIKDNIDWINNLKIQRIIQVSKVTIISILSSICLNIIWVVITCLAELIWLVYIRKVSLIIM